MAVKNVVLDPTFGNNLSGQQAIEVIFSYTVANSLDDDTVPRKAGENVHFLNLGDRKPYVKRTDGTVIEDLSDRGIADALLWNYQNSHEITFGDIWAFNVLNHCSC